jgi:hypothetical protein
MPAELQQNQHRQGHISGGIRMLLGQFYAGARPAPRMGRQKCDQLSRVRVSFIPTDCSPVLPLLMNGEPKNVEEVCMGLKMPRENQQE